MTLLGKPKTQKPRPKPRPEKRNPTKSERRMPARATPSEESKRIALLVAAAGLDKKATGVDILDVTGKVDYADFLVLMTGQNDRHVSAIAHAVDEALKKGGVHSVSVEGLPAARWVLIDFVDVVVHVFLEETRALYDLDGLWLDARRIPVAENGGSPKPLPKK
ncbi:MAG: ribosome silencing factor [Myxococcales bacterium]